MSDNSQVDAWHSTLGKNTRRPAILGLAFVALLCGGFGTWASTANIASATVVRGKFVATGTNKTIQHLEGGIIDEILVEEGEAVEVGQTLLRLSETATRAQMRRLELRKYSMLATRARLDASRSNADTYDFIHPDGLDDAEFVSAVDVQKSFFEATRARQRTEKTIMERRIDAIKDQIKGLEAQHLSSTEQLALMREEIAAATILRKKGLSTLKSYLQLRRAEFSLIGDIGEFTSEIGKARQRILETESEILNLQSKFQQEVADEYRTMQGELDDVEERLKAARDALQRLEVKAPVPGTVVKLNYNTPGGVIAPGSEILELLPTRERLIVEAYVRPEDKDNVFAGLDAEMRLTAINARTTPTIRGKVFYVSADTIEGKTPNEVFYVARAHIDESTVKLPAGVKITPGMPAEVFIVTGEHTLVDYIVRPIVDSFNRAFRET